MKDTKHIDTNNKWTNSLIKKGLIGSTIIFTVLSVIFIILFSILNLKNDLGAMIKATQLLFFYPFSLSLSFANIILNNDKLSKPLKILFHYLITTIAFILFIYIHIVDKFEAKNVIVVTFVFSVLYAIIMAIYMIVINIISKSKKVDKEYTSIYKKN